MTTALHHRGPDASGVYQSGPAVLGHARLSIIDLSPDANQPMLSADGQVALVFNGEIYNFRELAAELRDAGVPLRTRSDTEVLLELYRLRGPSFVSKLRGMFAFAIWDARTAAPAAGARPPRQEAAVLPRRQARAVVRVRAAGVAGRRRHRAPRRSARAARLPGARLRAVRLRRHRGGAEAGARAASPCSRTASWPRSATGSCASQPRQRSAEDLVEELRHHLFEAVQDAAGLGRAAGRVPVGRHRFVGGRRDHEQGRREAGQDVFDRLRGEGLLRGDRTRARSRALYETDHHEEVLRPRAAELLPRLVRAYGEPFADPSALPTYLLSEMTRRHVTVALSGDGGDEALAGYTRYAHEKMTRLFQQLPRPLLLPVARFIERRFPGRKAGFLGELGATVRTHARRVQMGDIPRYAAQFGHFTPEQMEELCSPDLQAVGADAGRALFGRLLSEATATDALGPPARARHQDLPGRRHLHQGRHRVDAELAGGPLSAGRPRVDRVRRDRPVRPQDARLPRQVAVPEGAARSAAPQHPLPAEARLRHPARALAARRAAPAAARHVAVARASTSADSFRVRWSSA